VTATRTTLGRIQAVLDAPTLAAGSATLANPTAPPRIEFDDVGFDYGTESVLESLSFVLDPESTTVIVGPSGSGKSTILALIAGLHHPTRGRGRRRRPRPENEAAVVDALTADLRPRTRVIVAHRLASIRHADRVLFVDGGRVLEDGTIDDLLAAVLVSSGTNSGPPLTGKSSRSRRSGRRSHAIRRNFASPTPRLFPGAASRRWRRAREPCPPIGGHRVHPVSPPVSRQTFFWIRDMLV
jgi:ABC-type protease/lipase transport system fused ATPase/permease subunit